MIAALEQLVNDKCQKARLRAQATVDAWLEAISVAQEAGDRVGRVVPILSEDQMSAAVHLRDRTIAVAPYVDLVNIASRASESKLRIVTSAHQTLERLESEVRRNANEIAAQMRRRLQDEHNRRLEQLEAQLRNVPAAPPRPSVIGSVLAGLGSGLIALIIAAVVILIAEVTAQHGVVLGIPDALLNLLMFPLAMFVLLSWFVVPVYRYQKWKTAKWHAEAPRRELTKRLAEERDRGPEVREAWLADNEQSPQASLRRVVAARQWLKDRTNAE